MASSAKKDSPKGAIFFKLVYLKIKSSPTIIAILATKIIFLTVCVLVWFIAVVETYEIIPTAGRMKKAAVPQI